jgi:hypothetical protein
MGDEEAGRRSIPERRDNLKYEVWYSNGLAGDEQVLAEFPSIAEAQQFVDAQEDGRTYSIRSVQTIPTVRWVNVTGLIFALLQSACTAVLAISGFRVLIGLSALAAAAGVNTPAKGFHQDAIRIPMMLLALLGALANLYSVWRVRSLRARPAAQWRVQPVSREKLRSERLQIALAIVTMVLLAAEWTTHSRLHHG